MQKHWETNLTKNGQDVIIWSNLVVLEYPMLYTKFQGHRPLGSEGDIWTFYHIRAWKPSWSCDPEHWINFHPNIPWRLNMKSGFNQPSIFEEKKFENVESEWPWTKFHEWPWPLIFIKLHALIKLTASTNFGITDYYSFWKIHCFTFFPKQKHKGLNLTLP